MKFPALLWSDMLPGHCHFLLSPVTHPMGLPHASSLHSEFCTREGIHTQFHKGSVEGTLHSLLTRVALAVDSPPESWQAGWEACISNICLFSTQGVLPPLQLLPPGGCFRARLAITDYEITAVWSWNVRWGDLPHLFWFSVAQSQL